MKTLYDVEFNLNTDGRLAVSEGLRIVLILKGTIKVSKSATVMNYQKGDVFIINYNEQYQILKHTDAIVISICLTESYLRKYMYDFQDREFILNRDTLQDVIYQQCVNAIAKIGTVFIRKGEFYKLYIEQQLIDLVFILTRYIPTIDKEKSLLLKTDQRLDYVCDYIERHYAEHINLTEMADKVGLSTTYLSKLFKQQKKMGFNQYINHIRLEHCKNDLVETNESITTIAYKNGFSSSNILLKHFKASTNETPSEFRMKYQNKSQKIAHDDNIQNATYQTYLYYLSLFINQNIGDIVQSPDAQKVLDISLAKTNKSISHFQHVIQIGYIESLLMQRVRKQLIEVKKLLGVNHVLIKDPIEIGHIRRSKIESDEIIPNIHSYMEIDEAINFLMTQQIGLGIELKPPRSATNFNEYYKEMGYFLEHIFNALPDSEALNCIIYIQCTDEVTFKKIVDLFNKYFDNLKIVLNVNIDHLSTIHEVENILNNDYYCIDNIAFSANQNDMIDFKSIEGQQYEMAKRHIFVQYNKIVETLKLEQNRIPFILLNWNTLTGDTHLTNGEYFRAGIIFEQLIEMNDSIQMIGYWLNFELHQQFQLNDTSTQLTGIELYHQFDGKRPAFFTSSFYKRLLKDVLYQNENCIVLGSYDHFQIVMWDAEHYNPYFVLNDQNQYLTHKEYRLNVRRMVAGTYKVKHLTLDKNNGALYTVWQHYNTRHGMDEETIDYVNRISYPKMEVSEVNVQDAITYYLKLQTNAVQIIEFKKYR
ncbi:transcriptional regulator AryK [Staphylococcus caeli]|uniref:Regulatory protein n=1 Tax=Staphylococcus caeli TaxID=2201815 RepID=A0A1D4J8I0_9STAP|nr:helix-turn-helix domain-containing protein [Staphylococcus caeli]SCS39768.1 regulatory protein [Staphylococcus caeli]SCS58139.1 regulatory protein [Staphylococcus caeli]